MLPAVAAVPVYLGDLLDGGSARQVALDDHAVKGRTRSLEARVGSDEAGSAEVLVKTRSKVVAELIRDQSWQQLVNVCLYAHDQCLRRISSGDIEDVNAVKFRDALGGGRAELCRQARHRVRVTCTGRRVEVQHLDEQPANIASPLRR